MENKPILELKNITKIYKEDSNNSIKVIEESSFKLFNGESVAMIGHSGCGKSTFLQICGLLDDVDCGEVVINNIDTTKLNDNKKTEIRKKNIGFVYQMHHLFPEFNVYENIALPLMINNKQNFKQEIIDLLEYLNIENKINCMPSQLSGGEKQRVAIARAIINKPKIILADEPTGNLDEKNSLNVVKMLLNICEKYNTAVVIVTHNLEIAKQTKRTITIKNHKIIDL